jgi:carboxymethylenebutenolidase
MQGRMIDFDAGGSPAPGYLATPDDAPGPGVVVLHAWWGLTEPFRQVCDRLAEAGFAALAPDLYRGKTATTVAEAEALAEELGGESERARGDIAGAVRFMCQDGAANPADGRAAVALVGFSLGGAYALKTSAELVDEIAAVVTFYTSYTGPDYRHAQAAYLCHFAENDAFDPPEVAEEMKQAFETAGRQATFYIYPGTAHWFMEANRPDVYDAAAAALAWERSIAFLNAQLRLA